MHVSKFMCTREVTTDILHKNPKLNRSATTTIMMPQIKREKKPTLCHISTTTQILQ